MTVGRKAHQSGEDGRIGLTVNRRNESFSPKWSGNGNRTAPAPLSIFVGLFFLLDSRANRSEFLFSRNNATPSRPRVICGAHFADLVRILRG